MIGYEIEPSVQMRLYALNKRQFFLVFITFFVSFGISILVGLAGPPITEQHNINGTSVLHHGDIYSGPFNLKSPSVSTFNQQLWLTASMTTNNEGEGMFEEPFEVGLQIRGMVEEKKTKLVYDGKVHNQTRVLKCHKTKCDTLILLHLSFLDYPHYVINVYFNGLNRLKTTISSINFKFTSYNSSFTQLEIWFRFVFLVLAFITTCFFAHSLKRFSIRDWSIEQKWMSVLLPLLLLYNNPIFPLTFLVNSWVPSLFDTMFLATFLGALLLFWLCIYHGVRQNKRKCSSFYMPKLIVVGFIWIVFVVMSTWQNYNELQDPTYYYRLDYQVFLTFKIFFFVSGGIYLLYLIYLLVRAFGELRSMPYFDLRLKFMTSMMCIVLFISVMMVLLRFGTGAFSANFVVELSSYNGNSAESLSFYGLLNFYLFTIAYVYSPSKNAIHESHFKDNPALSMLNDSDDEVVYGSDVEESAALTRKSHTRYDSDEDGFS